MHESVPPCHGKGTLFYMNASDGLWRQWSGQRRAFLPEAHGHRSKTLAFCVLGVVLAGSTRLPKVAEALVGISAAKTPSIERRLSRFLANQQLIVVPLWSRCGPAVVPLWSRCGPAVEPLAGPAPALLARSTPALRPRRDGAGRPRDRAVFRSVGPFPPLAGQLAGPAGAPAMGAAPVGGGRRAPRPGDPSPRSRRVHAGG